MSVASDLRFVARSLARNPSFVTAAVLSLALGIGANTAMFTIADQMLVRALPVKDPGSLRLFQWTGQFIGGSTRGFHDTFSYPMYADLRDSNPVVFTGIAARYQDTVDVGSGGGTPERAITELVSGNFFTVLGVPAAIGRTLTAQDDKVKGGEPYVVLSYEYWKRRFGGSPAVLNSVVDVNGHPMTVIGVAQRGFRGFEALSPSDIFVPLAMKTVVTPTWDHMNRRDSIWLKVFARLRPGVSAARAQSAMAIPYRAALDADLRSVARPEAFRSIYLRDRLELIDASKGFQQTQEVFAKPLYVLLAMVGTLLLIACVNVANLLITRASGRQKEVAIRMSLGATRSALVRLIMTESVVVALISGFLGLLFAEWIASVLVGMLPLDNISVAIDTTPDPRVLAFTAGLSLLTALLFGLVPALQTTTPDIAPTLKNEAGAISTAGRQVRLRRVLVASQVALSLLLLVGAGLFARSLQNVLSTDTGIAAARLLQFSIDPSRHNYTPQRSYNLFLEAQNALARLPGVAAVSAASYALLTDGWENTIHVEGYRAHAGEDMQAGYEEVLPRFFATVGAPLLAGREFTERDAGELKVVIVNEAFAKRFFPHSAAVGRHLGWGGGDGPSPYEIVGVVRNMKVRGIKEQERPNVFTPLLQNDGPGAVTFYLRTSLHDPAALGSGAQRIMRRLDPSLPVYDLKTVEAQVEDTSYLERMFATLSCAFGLFATLLASVGLYGVTAHAVAQRRQEIGIRIALGAERGAVLKLVMREVLLLMAAGTVVGVPAALALGRVVQSQLYGVRATDPAVIAGSVAVVAIVSTLAAWFPAQRATRIDPLEALRYE